MIAGSAKLDITPHSPNHLAGYANRDHPHEGVHDPLSIRALYVSNGSQELALVSADILWFREEVLEPIHKLIEQELGIAPEYVMLCGTHTHSAPTTSGPNVNKEYLHFPSTQTLAAVSLAKNRAQPAFLSVSRGTSQIGINRREQKPTGEVVLGENPDGPIDREIILIAVATDSGTVAEVCGFATHGTVMGGDNYLISGDWCGIAAAEVEGSGGTFLFMNGGAANVNPRGRISRPSAFEIAETLAKEFVGDIEDARKTTTELDGDETLSGKFVDIELPRKLRDIEDGMGHTRRVRIHGIRLGPVRILGFPGEVFSQTSMAVKAAFPSKVVAVNSYTSGGSAGYVAVKEAFDTGGYEVRVSPYSEDAEAVLRSEFIKLAKALE